MNKFRGIIICILGVIALAGCMSLRRLIQPAGKLDATLSLPAYSGPKARITIGDFQIKTAGAAGEVASGLRQMLVTALNNSGRFLVTEPQAITKAGEKTNSLDEKDRLKPKGLIISAQISDFEPEGSGGRGGVGGGGSAASGSLGGLLGVALNKAHIALEIRIIDISTSENLALTRVEGQASDISGAVMAGSSEKWGVGENLAIYRNTPMEKAMRICIIEAVRYIAQVIPATYYKY